MFYTFSYFAVRLKILVLYDVERDAFAEALFSIDAAEAKELLELETTDCYVLVLTIVRLHLTALKCCNFQLGK